MAHVTPEEEEAALTEIMQVLEAQPEDTTTSTSLVSVTKDDNIPAQREKLAILVSTGKSKEAIGVQLTHEQVKRLTDKNVQKYSKGYEAYIGNKTNESLIDSFTMLYSKGVGMVVSIDDVKALQEELNKDYIINQELSTLAKRYEAYIGNKTNESLIDSFIMLYSKGVGMVVSIDDVKALQEELNKDYIINQELSTLAGGLALRFGRFLALANTALITAKHIKFEKENGYDVPPPLPPNTPITHPTRDSEGSRL